MADGTVLVVELQRGRITACIPDGRKETVGRARRQPQRARDRARRRGRTSATAAAGTSSRSATSRSRFPSCRRTTRAAASSGSTSTTGAVTGALHRVRRAPAHRPERSRVRRARRHVVHRSRRDRKAAYSTSGASTTRCPTGRRSAKWCSRRSRRTGSGSRPTDRAVRRPRRTPVACTRGTSPGPARSTEVRPVRIGQLLCGLPGMQFFDSLAIDGDGNVVVATLVTGALTVISPTGEVLDQVAARRPDGHQRLLRRRRPAHRVRDAVGDRPSGPLHLASPRPPPQLQRLTDTTSPTTP